MKSICHSIVILISILVVNKAYGQDRTSSTISAWSDVEKHIKLNEWSQADSAITFILDSCPDKATKAMLLSNLGMIRHYAGNDSLSLTTLTQAHEIAPASVTILSNRAKVFTSAGQIVDAINDYNSIELLDPSYPDTYLYRGILYLYHGYPTEASSDLQHLETLRPNDENTLIALASLYSIIDEHEKASSYYSRLISATPCAEYYAGRAMCSLQLDRLTDAAEDIADGFQLETDYSELYLCRALLNKKRYLTNDAREDALRAIELGANPSRVKSLLGEKILVK